MIDWVLSSVDDIANAWLIKGEQFVVGFLKSLSLEPAENFVGEFDSRDGVGHALFVPGAKDYEVAGLIDEIFDMIVRLHAGTEEVRSNEETCREPIMNCGN